MTRDPETLSPARISELQRQAIERGYEINAKATGSVVVAGVTGSGELVSATGPEPTEPTPNVIIAASLNGHMLGTADNMVVESPYGDDLNYVKLFGVDFTWMDPGVTRYFAGFLKQAVTDKSTHRILVGWDGKDHGTIADKCRVIGYRWGDDGRLAWLQASGDEYEFWFSKEKKP